MWVRGAPHLVRSPLPGLGPQPRWSKKSHCLSTIMPYHEDMARTRLKPYTRERGCIVRAGLVASLLLCSSLCFATPPIVVSKLDYVSNIRVTNYLWFYKNEDGTAQDPLAGNGKYPTVEFVLGGVYCPYFVDTHTADHIVTIACAAQADTAVARVRQLLLHSVFTAVS